MSKASLPSSSFTDQLRNAADVDARRNRRRKVSISHAVLRRSSDGLAAGVGLIFSSSCRGNKSKGRLVCRAAASIMPHVNDLAAFAPMAWRGDDSEMGIWLSSGERERGGICRRRRKLGSFTTLRANPADAGCCRTRYHQRYREGHREMKRSLPAGETYGHCRNGEIEVRRR